MPMKIGFLFTPKDYENDVTFGGVNSHYLANPSDPINYVPASSDWTFSGSKF